jgi:hypothetical protein
VTAVEERESLGARAPYPSSLLGSVKEKWWRAAALGAPSARWRRRPVAMVLSLLVVVTSAAVFSASYAHARRLVPVLEVTAPVAKGQLIGSADLTEVDVRVGRSVAVVDASDASSVVGMRAAVSLSTGELLSPGELTTSAPLASGDAEVGVVAAPGQLPSGGLVPGDTVMVVETSPPGAAGASAGVPLASSSGVSPASAPTGAPTAGPASGAGVPASPVLVPEAQVADVRAGPSGSGAAATTLVSLVVPAAAAPDVAVAAAADEVGLVLLPASHSASASGRSGAVGEQTRGGA